MTLALAVIGIASAIVGLAGNAVLLYKLLKGQDAINVKVNGHLGWYIDRTEQLHAELTHWGIDAPPAPTEAPEAPGGTLPP